MSKIEKKPIVYWAPSHEAEHMDEYRKLLQSWYPQHDMSLEQFRAERLYVQEQVEAKAAAEGVPFILVKATPRWVKREVSKFGWALTQETAQQVVFMLASMPGFDCNRVYDVD